MFYQLTKLQYHSLITSQDIQYVFKFLIKHVVTSKMLQSTSPVIDGGIKRGTVNFLFPSLFPRPLLREILTEDKF